ncbi:radical SAM protein, partial [Rhizobium ruizarguesonis]
HPHLVAGLGEFPLQEFCRIGLGKQLLLEIEPRRKPHIGVRVIAIGTNTDPYQPIEKEWSIMRGILEVLNKANHPVSIVTKSA